MERSLKGRTATVMTVIFGYCLFSSFMSRGEERGTCSSRCGGDHKGDIEIASLLDLAHDDVAVIHEGLLAHISIGSHAVQVRDMQWLSLAVVNLNSLRSFTAVLTASVSTRLGNSGRKQYLAIFEAPPPPKDSLFIQSDIRFPHWPTPRMSTLSMISNLINLEFYINAIAIEWSYSR